MGWLEKSDIELTSAKVKVEVEAKFVNKAKLKVDAEVEVKCNFAFPVYLGRGLFQVGVWKEK